MVEKPKSIKEEIKALLDRRGRRDKSGTESNTISEDTIQVIIPGIYYLMEGGFSDDPNTFHNANIGTWDPVTQTATLTENIDIPIQILIDDVTLTAAIDPNTNTRYKISGSGLFGIYINSYPETRRNITITNMDISDCEDGIYAAETANLIIQENTIHDIDLNGIILHYDNKSGTIQKNSIYKCSVGIFLGDSESNTILKNDINNNEIGILFSAYNDNNVIKENSISENEISGINFYSENNSNIIQNNTIYENGAGIIFTGENNSNIIQCNLIKENNIDTGVVIKGSNNLIKRNNFINNQPNAVNSGNNTFSGNYWSDWDGTGPYIFAGGVDNNPSRFPVSCTIFKQFSVQEYVTIPLQKPCAEEILNCLVEVEIEQIKGIKTPSAMSYEGQILRGHKAVIEGNLHQKLVYIADDSSQSVHAAHFTTPFSTYIILPEDYVKGTPLHINSVIEDVYYKLMDKRRIFKNVTLYLEAKEM